MREETQIYFIDGPLNGQRAYIGHDALPSTWHVSECFLAPPSEPEDLPYATNREHVYALAYARELVDYRLTAYYPIRLPEDVAAIYLYEPRACRTS